MNAPGTPGNERKQLSLCREGRRGWRRGRAQAGGGREPPCPAQVWEQKAGAPSGASPAEAPRLELLSLLRRLWHAWLQVFQPKSSPASLHPPRGTGMEGPARGIAALGAETSEKMLLVTPCLSFPRAKLLLLTALYT